MTWEGVESELNGPKLNCFTEPDYGVPGNADTIGIITNNKTIKNNPDWSRSSLRPLKRVTKYAYANPDDAAQILVDEAPDANLKPEFVKKSMQVIVDGQYWGDPAKIKDGSFVLGTNDFKGAQEYFDFLAEEDAYTDSHDKIIHEPHRPRTCHRRIHRQVISDMGCGRFLGDRTERFSYVQS